MSRATQQAASYLRVSGAGQIGGDGFPRQREACRRYAKAAGLELVAEYRDEGVSGTSELADREGLSELFARIRSNGVRVVLVERADRLARDLIVGELILSQFRDVGVKVVAADSGTELTGGDGDPTRKLIRQVLGAVAEFEKSVLVAKLRAARVRKRKATGKCEGRKAFGTTPAEKQVVELIHRWRRKPKGGARPSFAKIAKQLNEAGYRTKDGKQWRDVQVRRVLVRGRSVA
jgi:DNA invertase Pin-like site-specific DNA recombinase